MAEWHWHADVGIGMLSWARHADLHSWHVDVASGVENEVNGLERSTIAIVIVIVDIIISIVIIVVVIIVIVMSIIITAPHRTLDSNFWNFIRRVANDGKRRRVPAWS